jgi:hypothetical protein
MQEPAVQLRSMAKLQKQNSQNESGDCVLANEIQPGIVGMPLLTAPAAAKSATHLRMQGRAA